MSSKHHQRVVERRRIRELVESAPEPPRNDEDVAILVQAEAERLAREAPSADG